MLLPIYLLLQPFSVQALFSTSLIRAARSIGWLVHSQYIAIKIINFHHPLPPSLIANMIIHCHHHHPLPSSHSIANVIHCHHDHPFPSSSIANIIIHYQQYHTLSSSSSISIIMHCQRDHTFPSSFIAIIIIINGHHLALLPFDLIH